MTDLSETVPSETADSPKPARSRTTAEATRQAILEAATAEFAENGRLGAAMRAIARRAGCPQSLVHHHFGSKDALWRAVSDRIHQDWFAVGGAFLDNPAPDRAAVRALLGSLWHFWQGNPRALRMTAWRLLEGVADSDLAAQGPRFQRFIEAFRRAQGTGAVRSDLPAEVLLMAVYGAITQACLAHSAARQRPTPFDNADPILDGLAALVAPVTTAGHGC